MPGFGLEFDRAAFSGEAPLFPLPGTILLPGNAIPLHVFEPRYRAMVRDALAGERYVAMALLRPGYHDDYEGAPAIEPHVCLGRIVLEEPLPDGRWNILLAGLRRARVVREDRSRPYRLATLELLEDLETSSETATARGVELAQILASTPPRLVRDPARFQVTLRLLGGLPGELPLGVLLDLIAESLTLGLGQRLELLETPDVLARAELLLDMLRARIDELQRLEQRPSWPPGFSKN